MIYQEKKHKNKKLLTVLLFLMPVVYLFYDLVEDLNEGLPLSHMFFEVLSFVSLSSGIVLLVSNKLIFYATKVEKSELKANNAQLKVNEFVAKTEKQKQEIQNAHQSVKALQEEVVYSQKEILNWREKTAKIQQDVYNEILNQFQIWCLTTKEIEVALLLLKGLSIKEIASIQGVSDKTIKHQSLSVYKKSKLSGRAELAAFFIEEFTGISN